MLLMPPRNLSPSLQFGRSANNTNQTTSANNTSNGLITQDSLSIKHQKRFWDAPSVELTEMDITDTTPEAISTPSDVIRHLSVQQALHPNETGRTKLQLNSIAEPSNMFEMSEMITLLEKPIDAVVTSITGKEGVSIFANPRVRSFMMPQSSIAFSPDNEETGWLPKKNNSIQTDRWLRDNSHELLTSLVSEKVGKLDRKEFLDILKAKEGQKSLSALEALHLGEKGLIDAILVGNQDRVIVRKDLDDFLKQKKKDGWNEKDIKRFLQEGFRASEIPSHPIHEVFPDSLPGLKSDTNLSENPKLFTRAIFSKGLTRGEVATEKAYQLPTDCQVTETPKHASPAYILKNVQGPQQSILNNNVVFFTDGISHSSINTCIQALKRLDKNAQLNNSAHHIPLLINSPGGEIPASHLFTNTIKRLKTPIDIIVTGLAASAAAMHMLPSATGLRLSFPGAYIMLHEASIRAKAKDVSDDMKKSEEARLKQLSVATGRKYQDIRRDSLNDYWISSIEAMFYGDKGLIDGIMVGPKHIITRQDVTDYLKEKLGSLDAVNSKVKERLERRRDMNRETDHEFDANDPFDNVFKTIHDVAKRKSKVLGQDPEFKHSGPNSQSKTFELIPIKAYKPFGVSFPGISIIGD